MNMEQKNDVYQKACLEAASKDLTTLNPASLNPASLNPASLNPASLNPASLDPLSLDPLSLDPLSLDLPSSEQQLKSDIAILEGNMKRLIKNLIDDMEKAMKEQNKLQVSEIKTKHEAEKARLLKSISDITRERETAQQVKDVKTAMLHRVKENATISHQIVRELKNEIATALDIHGDMTKPLQKLPQKFCELKREQNGVEERLQLVNEAISHLLMCIDKYQISEEGAAVQLRYIVSLLA
jgi:chromosome segregation ATPase